VRLDHLLSGKRVFGLERSHLSVVEGKSPAARRYPVLHVQE
jgi:hypothetical protein